MDRGCRHLDLFLDLYSHFTALLLSFGTCCRGCRHLDSGQASYAHHSPANHSPQRLWANHCIHGALLARPIPPGRQSHQHFVVLDLAHRILIHPFDILLDPRSTGRLASAALQRYQEERHEGGSGGRPGSRTGGMAGPSNNMSSILGWPGAGRTPLPGCALAHSTKHGRRRKPRPQPQHR